MLKRGNGQQAAQTPAAQDQPAAQQAAVGTEFPAPPSTGSPTPSSPPMGSPDLPTSTAGEVPPAAPTAAPEAKVAPPRKTKTPPKPAAETVAPTPVPEAPPVAEPTPPPPPAPAPTPAFSALTFRDVKVLVPQGNSLRDRDAVLTLGGDHIAVVDRSNNAQISSTAYSSVRQAFFSRSKQPKWKGPDGKEQTASVDLGRMSFFRGDRNWLILMTQSDTIFIRLEDADLKKVLPTIEQRTGVKIQR
jgi:outer membrane biosynthesis protein TonB